MPFVARWTKLLSNTSGIARSSHATAVLGSRIAIYGGELMPRTPIDGDSKSTGAVHCIDLRNPGSDAPNLRTFTARGDLPAPRVGATMVSSSEKLYLWGGRGGADMAPLPEAQAGVYEGTVEGTGEVWWKLLKPDGQVPQPRSYHTAAAHEDKFYAHAGTPASGRLGTLHSFDIHNRRWAALTPAPAPGRGGTVMATASLLSRDVLLRFGGFAGTQLPTDQTLDLYDIRANTWQSVVPEPDPNHGHPGPRSVHGFVSYNSPKRPYAVALLWHGEKTPSSKGHEGAGEFWDDVWMLVSKGERADRDAVSDVELAWRRVTVTEGDPPEGRGWFQPASVEVEGKTRAVMVGGLLESNERSGEVWALDVD